MDVTRFHVGGGRCGGADRPCIALGLRLLRRLHKYVGLIVTVQRLSTTNDSRKYNKN